MSFLAIVEQDIHSRRDHDVKYFLESMTPIGSLLIFFSKISYFEMNEKQFRLSEKTQFLRQFTACHLFFAMIVSIPVYCFCIFYLENVSPFKSKRKSIFFLLSKSYWYELLEKEYIPTSETPEENLKLFQSFKCHSSNPVIMLRDVSKSFGTKSVVKNMNLNIYRNQITILLGHNGAGKSVTVKMIAGIIEPSAGRIFINGYNVHRQVQLARKNISICLQENKFIRELNVYNHLKLFSILKGTPSYAIEAEIDETLKILRLSSKKFADVEDLSGGMKRKVSIGMAFVGKTNILILDEPASNMDPESRRLFWQVLFKLKQNRTIILITHHSEDAERLGDRVIIMNSGNIRCDGSPHFLKRSLGAGYRLKLVKKSKKFNSESFLYFIKNFLPSASLNNETYKEVIYNLETSSSKTNTNIMPRMNRFFEALEEVQDSLFIASLSLSFTDIGDVFLSIGDGLWNPSEMIRKLSNKKMILSSKEDLISGVCLVMNQLKAIIMKRFHHAKRYPLLLFMKISIASLILPLSQIFQDLSITVLQKLQEPYPVLNALTFYGEDTKSFYYGERSLFNKYQIIVEQRDMGRIIFTHNESDVNFIRKSILNSMQGSMDYKQRHLYGLGVSEKHYDLWINYDLEYSILIGLNMLYETILCTARESWNCSKFNVQKTAKPQGDDEKAMFLNYLNNFFASWFFNCIIFLPISISFSMAFHVVYPIQQRNSNARFIELMSPLSVPVYYYANFLFDFILHSVSTVLFFLTLFILDKESLLFFNDAKFNGLFDLLLYSRTISQCFLHFLVFAMFLHMLLIGFALIPMSYMAPYLIAKQSNAFFTMVWYYFYTGFTLNISIIVLKHLKHFEKDLDFIVTLLDILSPHFAFLYGFQHLYLKNNVRSYCYKFLQDSQVLQNICKKNGTFFLEKACCPKPTCEPWCLEDQDAFALNEKGIGREMLSMFVLSFIFFGIILVIESNRLDILKLVETLSYTLFLSSPSAPTLLGDGDVALERKKIHKKLETVISKNVLTVSDLRKRYPEVSALNQLSFAVKKGECFGLLGVSGSGKTTAFSILVGAIPPTSGEAYMNVKNRTWALTKNAREFQTRIGYCPQTDCLLGNLTGLETLQFYAKIHGISKTYLQRDVDNIIKMVGIEEYANDIVKNYGGGTKRKLSIAIALLGSPKLILLDEPTSGIDPVAKKRIWKALGYIKSNMDCSMILTSHSMDECEALCSRLAIMIDGSFMCMGSSRRLCSKYGQGYLITITLKKGFDDDEIYCSQVEDRMRSSFKSVVLRDFHFGFMCFHITDHNEKWSNIFANMIAINEEFDFEDYYLANTSLEEIFLKIAKFKPETYSSEPATDTATSKQH